MPSSNLQLTLQRRCDDVLYKFTIDVLRSERRSSVNVHFIQDSRITDYANEAKDNVKFLYTLDKFFGPLVKCNPVNTFYFKYEC